MIKKITLADNFADEKFLLSRAMAFIAENMTEKSTPVDLAEYIFVLPSAEAGRLFREKAALFFRRYGGVTRLTTILPEQLLFSSSDINYSDVQVLDDWFEILKNTDPANFQSKIFPEIEYTDEILLSLAENFSKIRENILLESGLDSADFLCSLPENSPLKLKLDDYIKLEKLYLAKLGTHSDKAQAIKNSLTSPFDKFSEVKKIILIENSELRGGIKLMLDRLAEKIEIIHLLNTTPDKLENFDEHGCPITEKMLKIDLPLNLEKQLRTFSSSIHEAEKIASFLNKNDLPSSIGIMNNELALTLTHILEEKNIEVYAPSVRFLKSFYWSRLFLTIADMYGKNISYEDVFKLASDDTFTTFFEVKDSVLLRTELEKLQRKHLLRDFESLCFFAKKYYNASTENTEKNDSFEETFNFCNALKNFSGRLKNIPSDSFPEGLWSIFAECASCANLSCMDINEAEISLEALKNTIVSVRNITDSKKRMMMFKHKLADTSLSGAEQYKDEALNFSGFLDLIWYENPSLILGGISEEAFSGSAVEDAFFPEHIRNELNWSSAHSRFGADIHRFEQLLAQYSNDEFFITFAAASANGELNTLPRVFFNVNEKQLIKNCDLLFNSALMEKNKSAETDPEPLRYTSHISEKMPSKISVTAFKKYIECPYTFYLNSILRCEDQGRDLFELQPNQDGDILHNVLENYGNTFASDVPDIQILKEHCLKELDRVFYACTGFAPGNLALMQNEELRKNIEAFAEYENKMRSSLDRHQIIQTEKKIDITVQELIERLPQEWLNEMPLLNEKCRNIRLVGKIDRIDSFYDNNCHIYRIIDYKSSKEPKTPASVHLSRKCPDHLEPASLHAFTNDKGVDYYFSDMQLVIYSLFANFMRDELGIEDISLIECAYYNLPLNASDTSIVVFDVLDHDMLKKGAAALVSLINRIFAEQYFWPPNLKDQYGVARKYLECDSINDFEITKELK